jgi:hypothetical protein
VVGLEVSFVGQPLRKDVRRDIRWRGGQHPSVGVAGDGLENSFHHCQRSAISGQRCSVQL